MTKRQPEAEKQEEPVSLSESLLTSRLSTSKSTNDSANCSGLLLRSIDPVNFTSLYKLNLSSNLLNYDALKNAMNAFPSLTLLNLSSNKLEGELDLSFLTATPKLLVLDLSHNAITHLRSPPPETLKALVVTHNKLVHIDSLGRNLTNLVLGHNEFTDCVNLCSILPETLERVSLAHNKLTAMGDMSRCVLLRNISYNGNEIAEMNADYLPSDLELLDIGNNKIESLDIHTLSRFGTLSNLNTKGNPLKGLTEQMLVQAMPWLRVFDGSRIQKTNESFYNRREKIRQTRIAKTEQAIRGLSRELRMEKKKGKAEGDKRWKMMLKEMDDLKGKLAELQTPMQKGKDETGTTKQGSSSQTASGKARKVAQEEKADETPRQMSHPPTQETETLKSLPLDSVSRISPIKSVEPVAPLASHTGILKVKSVEPVAPLASHTGLLKVKNVSRKRKAVNPEQLLESGEDEMVGGW